MRAHTTMADRLKTIPADFSRQADTHQSHMPPVATPGGVTWASISQSGRENPDSAIGLYAGDAASYNLFWAQFRPVLIRYHGIAQPEAHEWQPGHDFALPTVLRHFPQVCSTRLRIARNLAGFRFPAAMSARERCELYCQIKAAVQTIPGTLYDLATLTSQQAQALAASHMLFDNHDRFMASANILDHWPLGRAVFVTAAGRSGLWINEEDHLRIFSIASGYDLPQAVADITQLLGTLEERLSFATSERLGYLTSCPSNLGTGLRASVRAHCTAAQAAQLQAMGLQLRGDAGEHGPQTGHIYDISPRQRLGLTENAILQQLNDALMHVFAPPRGTVLPLQLNGAKHAPLPE